MEPILQTHDFHSQKPRNVRLLVARLESDEDDWITDRGLLFHKNPEDWGARIENILHIAETDAVDVVIFPELSVPETIIPDIQKWSKTTGSTVIAGSHYHEEQDKSRISRCPVIIGGDVYFVKKNNPSPYEKSPIKGHGLSSSNEFFIFKNTSIGDFSVLICSDYLSITSRNIVLNSDLDFIFVSAFQNDSDDFYSRMSNDCEESHKGIYIAYSNMYQPNASDGRSACFGLIDRIFTHHLVDNSITDLEPQNKLCELGENQSYFIAEVDIIDKKPSFPRNIHSEPNFVFIGTDHPRDDKTIKFIQKIGHEDDRYRRVMDYFVPPNEYDDILAKLEQRKMVFIIGDPGIGKTYTAARILRHYFDKGYDPIWYVGLERTERLLQRKTLENFRPEKKQIIYFEDPFGRTDFERRDSINQVFGPLSDYLLDVDARVIITSRREIFERFTNENLSAIELDNFKEDMSVVKPSYGPNGLKEILDLLASEKCLWFQDSKSRKLVESAITSGSLNTPFAIRDLVLATEKVKSAEVLMQRIQNRKRETVLTFASELGISLPTTKLILTLVHLFGFKNQATLSQWFDAVLSTQDLGDRTKGKATFIQSLRLELGYRIEQYGSKRFGFRLTHPVYEEAIIQMALGDVETQELLRQLLIVIFSQDFDTYLLGISRQTIKHPTLATQMIKYILDNPISWIDLLKLSRMGMQIIATYDHSRDSEMLDLLKLLIKPTDLINLIHKETNLLLLFNALRFAATYENRMLKSGALETSMLFKDINWATVFEKFEQRDKTGIREKAGAILRILEAAYMLNNEVVQQYINGNTLDELDRKFFSLDYFERERFASLVKDLKKQRKLLSRWKALSLKRRSSARHELLMAAFENHPSESIIIDDGLVSELQNRRVSIFPPGIVDINGDFDAGTIVSLRDVKKNVVAVGIAEYSSKQIEVIRGYQSGQIIDVLGEFHGIAVIHPKRMIRDEGAVGFKQTSFTK